MRERLIEFWYFILANAKASAFGAFLLATFLVTEVVTIPYVTRYDAIFLLALGYQLIALVFRFERPREFAVILLFHVLATGMELFKTNPAIGSWTYPSMSGVVFAFTTVPLFTGFLYSAVGSYISRAFLYLKLSYVNFPAQIHLWVLAVLIYVNFFTHHFIYDIRIALFAYFILVFWHTKVNFKVYKKVRAMPFLLTALLTSCAIWAAENIGTFTKIWVYPSQSVHWHVVPITKLGSWYLLLILSFALVSIIYRDRLHPSGRAVH
jgi:uncharacterized membrane protein YoaT (DUF817 family)